MMHVYQYGQCSTYLNQPVKETGIQSLGQGIAGVARLLHVELHSNGLSLATPFAVHYATCQLVL